MRSRPELLPPNSDLLHILPSNTPRKMPTGYDEPTIGNVEATPVNAKETGLNAEEQKAAKCEFQSVAEREVKTAPAPEEANHSKATHYRRWPPSK